MHPHIVRTYTYGVSEGVALAGWLDGWMAGAHR